MTGSDTDGKGVLVAKKMKTTTLRAMILCLVARALHTLYRRRQSHQSLSIPRLLATPRRPFLAFSGSGLLLAYYRGISTYIRDHFNVDNLQLSAISGGCSTMLALAMGIDLYQIMLLGLHLKKHYLEQGIYLNTFAPCVDDLCQRLASIGVTDKDVENLSWQQRCYIGVTQCFPPGHQCVKVPSTLRDLAALWFCSMSVMPFFRTPGVYKGRYYVDGGFSAVYSIPEGQPWNDIIKVTCVPWWTTLLPPAMSIADIQPRRLMPTEIVVLYPWSHQQQLIKRGYEDAKLNHAHLVSRGLRPLDDAPLTPWAEWEKLFAAID